MVRTHGQRPKDVSFGILIHRFPGQAEGLPLDKKSVVFDDKKSITQKKQNGKGGKLGGSLKNQIECGIILNHE